MVTGGHGISVTERTGEIPISLAVLLIPAATAMRRSSSLRNYLRRKMIADAFAGQQEPSKTISKLSGERIINRARRTQFSAGISQPGSTHLHSLIPITS